MLGLLGNIGFVCRFIELIATATIFRDVEIGARQLTALSEALKKTGSQCSIDKAREFGIAIVIVVVCFAVSVIAING